MTIKTRDEVFNHLRDTLVELFEIDVDKIKPQAHLYTDLDIDSIDAVDLVLKLKEFTGQKNSSTCVRWMTWLMQSWKFSLLRMPR